MCTCKKNKNVHMSAPLGALVADRDSQECIPQRSFSLVLSCCFAPYWHWCTGRSLLATYIFLMHVSPRSLPPPCVWLPLLRASCAFRSRCLLSLARSLLRSHLPIPRNHPAATRQRDRGQPGAAAFFNFLNGCIFS